jgi:hypothetical protein
MVQIRASHVLIHIEPMPAPNSGSTRLPSPWIGDSVTVVRPMPTCFGKIVLVSALTRHPPASALAVFTAKD